MLPVLLSLLLASAPTLAAEDRGLPLVVAHRGASADAPENTLTAFRTAWELGIDAVEGDFHLTRDGKIVCHHDPTTDRLTGASLTVAESSLADLKALDVGVWKGAKFAGERIPTLSEVLEEVPAGKRFYLEVKCGPEIVAALVAQMGEHDPDASQITVISFNKEVVREVKRADPQRRAFWLVGFHEEKETAEWSPSVDEVIATAKAIRADGVDVQAVDKVVGQAFIDACQEASLSVHVWTVDDPAVASKFARLGVASITSNRPDAIRARLGRP